MNASDGAEPGQASKELFEAAAAFFPDGTSRVTIERLPCPRYIKRGEGAYLEDVDGNRFLDLNNNFTTLIHGHAFGPVTQAVGQQLRIGSCFANPTELELQLAELICKRIGRVDSIRFVNTGTEAVMFAIKAARALTGRPKVAKFEGAYHGSYDWAEISQFTHGAIWGSLERPNATPYYKGTPCSVLEEVVVLRFNDLVGLEKRLESEGDQLACLVVDPMPSRAGLIEPEPGFFHAINELCHKHGIVLISDEVLNFRQSVSGAAARFGLLPDLYCLGKIIGGGLPIGAVAGSRDAMSVFDASKGRPLLPQGGTFSANPLSMAAGFAAMVALDHGAFAHLEALGSSLRREMAAEIDKLSAPLCVTGAASLFRIHPLASPPKEFRDTALNRAGVRFLKELSRHFASDGIILPIEAAACLSTPMTVSDIEKIVDCFAGFLRNRTDLLDDLRNNAIRRSSIS